MSEITMLPDSGARKEFGSGAVRDIAEGKGRMDLIPISELIHLTRPCDCIRESMCNVDGFLRTKLPSRLLDAIDAFAQYVWGDIYTAIIEVSRHFEDGARKYSASNWSKGIPVHCYIDSALRHLMKFLRGDTDESHDRAYVWNLLCAHWTVINKPELMDLETIYDV